MAAFVELLGGDDMPWSVGAGSGVNPSVDQIIRRLAFHIHRRTLDPDVAEKVLATARITRKTLSRYSAYRPIGRNVSDLHAFGPRRLDLYAQICMAMDENPGRVLWAATVAGDYASMLALLSAEVHLQHKLMVGGVLGSPDTATTRVVAQGGQPLETPNLRHAAG